MFLITTFTAGIFFMELQHSQSKALALILVCYVLIAASLLRSAIFAKRIRRALRPLPSAATQTMG